MKNICIFTGARPNFIKVAPLIRAIESTDNCQYQLVYAGTADDSTLEASLFDDLQIPHPDVFLGGKFPLPFFRESIVHSFCHRKGCW